MFNKIYLLFFIITLFSIYISYIKIEFFENNFPFINWKINLKKKPCNKIKKLDNTSLIYKNFLSSKQCNDIINISKKYKLDMDNDIDKKPLYQIDLYDNEISNKELYKHIKKYIIKIMKENHSAFIMMKIILPP